MLGNAKFQFQLPRLDSASAEPELQTLVIDYADLPKFDAVADDQPIEATNSDDRCVFPPILCRCSLLTCLGGCLGVDVCLGGGSCRFCGQPLDGKRQHANSCMAG